MARCTIHDEFDLITPRGELLRLRRPSSGADRFIAIIGAGLRGDVALRLLGLSATGLASAVISGIAMVAVQI